MFSKQASAANPTASRRAFRDVSNRNGSTNNNGKAGKPAVAKRATGVKTRSMSIGGDVMLAPAAAAANNKHMVRGGRAAADPTSYQMTGKADDIDNRDSDDPLCATAYVEDLYYYFKEREASTSVRPTFMDAQPSINARMRSILIDWLVEVHLKFKLCPETLYLCVNLIDRYLERESVTRPKLQLVGVSALLVASKYEEIYPPELRDLVYICDRAYSKTDIIEMEEQILKTLEYRISVPSAHAFLVRNLKAGHADKQIVQLSCFLLDGTLQSYELLHYLPSQLAAASVFIARRVVGRNGWSPTLLHYSDYAEEEILPVARAIIKAKNSGDPELKAVSKKYSSSRYGGVASTALPIDF